MTIQLSEHFTYRKLLRFVLPSIGMMVFTSIYGVVDGYFVSNYAGSIPFAAINLILPFLMIFSAIGFMIGTGGTALVAMNLGMKNQKKANSIFSLLVYVIIAVGLIVSIAGQFLLKKVAIALGSTEEMLPYCVEYGRILLCSIVPFMLQNLFQSFLVVAERPKIGFTVTIAAGVTNMVLDWLLVGLLGLGVKGAALATALSQCVGGLIPLVYFIVPNTSTLQLGRTTLDGRSLFQACGNGFSEFLTNIAINIVAMTYNFQLMKYIGEMGISAYGVIMYVCFVFIAIFIGYSIGMAPIVGYNYGAANHAELKNIVRKSLTITLICSFAMLLLSEVCAAPLARLYVGYDAALLAVTIRALRIHATSFFVMGYNVFSSAFFTALNNGRISATISFLRALVFQIGAVLILPALLGVDGIWLSNICAEGLALLISIYFLVTRRKEYHY